MIIKLFTKIDFTLNKKNTNYRPRRKKPVMPKRHFGVTQTGELIHLDHGPSKSIQFSKYNSKDDETKVERVNAGGKSQFIAKWGKNNDLPQRREEMICDNNIVGQLIARKREIVLGQGLYTFIEKWEDGKKKKIVVPIPDQILEWLDDTDWDDYIECSANNFFMHANTFTEQIKYQHKDGIARIHSKSCKNIRAGRQNSRGVIDKYHYYTSWGKQMNYGSGENSSPISIPAFVKGAPLRPKSILHTGDKLFYDGYYYSPSYWGGKEWISTSNDIPRFHQHNLENGYNIRYHIEIPADYFLDTEKYQNATNDGEKKKLIEDAKAAEQKFIDDMNNFLAGTHNSGRAVYTKYDVYKAYDNVREYPGIKITPLSADLKDEALLKLFEKSNEANISAQGIHPILASIQTQGKLSSGSDIRNALLLFLATGAPLPRRILLKPLQVVQKLNGWDPKLKFGFEDSLITKLDDNPKGIEKPTEKAA